MKRGIAYENTYNKLRRILLASLHYLKSGGRHLLLLLGFLGILLLLSEAHEAGISSSLAKSGVALGGSELVGDGNESNGISLLGDGRNINIGLVGIGDLGGGGVALLNNTSTAGEDNQSGLVTLKAINIKSQRLLTLVSSSVINGDSYSLSELSVDTSSLKQRLKWKES